MKKMLTIIILLTVCMSLQGCKGGGGGSDSASVSSTSSGVFQDPMSLLNEGGTGDDPLPWTTGGSEEGDDNSGGDTGGEVGPLASVELLPDSCADSGQDVVPCIEGPGIETHSTPEPATFFLLFNSLLGFAFFRRKK